MKTFVRFCLGVSIAFEAIVTLCIFFGVVPGMLVARLTPWAAPFGVLTVCTIAVFVVVGKSWERMSRAEKAIVIVPAVAPLAAFKFMFIVIVGFAAGVAILAVVGFILSVGGGAGNVFGTGGSSGGSGHSFGSWWGDDRVRTGSDGRPISIGNARVEYGPDGDPILIGKRKVLYGGDGKIAWIGDDRVKYSRDGSLASVGKRRVRP